MLTEAELRGLVALHGEQTVSDFAANLDRSLNYTSELVDRLQATGLVETRQEGKSTLVRPSEAKALELLTNLVQQDSHIDWPELLAGATLRVLYYLDTPRTATELATVAGVHRSTVYRALKPLQHRGIVFQTDTGNYALSEGFEPLTALAHELAHHGHRQLVEQQTTTYTILWESLDEFLVQTATDIEADGFMQTGPELFETYGLPCWPGTAGITATQSHEAICRPRSSAVTCS